jgi:hypothetical protein
MEVHTWEVLGESGKVILVADQVQTENNGTNMLKLYLEGKLVGMFMIWYQITKVKTAE